MLLERRKGGNTTRQVEVEAAHRRIYGTPARFFQIAVDLYDEHGSQGRVQQAILARYGVQVSEKTASLWINRGLEERRRVASAATSAEVA